MGSVERLRWKWVCAVARMATVKGGSLTFGKGRTRVAQTAWNGASRQLTEQQMGPFPSVFPRSGGFRGDRQGFHSFILCSLQDPICALQGHSSTFFSETHGWDTLCPEYEFGCL